MAVLDAKQKRNIIMLDVSIAFVQTWKSKKQKNCNEN
jgi:hypothetical protein